MPRSVFRYSIAGCALCALSLVAGCSAPQPGAPFNDPYEATNRQVHAFNKGLDQALLRPGGQVLDATDGLTQPISNFADNAALPGMVLNGLLQGDVDGAITNTFRFLLNTSVGLGGLVDVAGEIGIEEQSTDFGQTLAVWGVPEGAYLELPVLGPSTERDAAGEIVDLLIDPLGALGTDNQIDYGTATRVVDIAISRGRYGEIIDGVLYDSADSYAQTRLAYLQNRRFELGEAPPEVDVIDPFSDELSLEGFE